MARTKTDPAKAVAIIRVSTDDQRNGPEVQLGDIERWAAREGIEIVAVFTDHLSGGTALDKRPGLMSAVQALKEHRAGILVAQKRDRIARDTMLAAMVERLAQRNGAVVRTADGVADGDSPADQLMRQMLDAFAQYERAMIRSRTEAALALKRSKGQKTGGDAPFGFTSRDSNGTAVLVEDPVEQAIIAMLRQLKSSGMSYRALAAHCKSNGIRSRRGAWSHTTLCRLFQRIDEGRFTAAA